MKVRFLVPSCGGAGTTCSKTAIKVLGKLLPQNPLVTVECSGCEKTTKHLKEDFKRCSACRGVFYCSEACQRNDWPKHRKNCVPEK